MEQNSPTSLFGLSLDQIAKSYLLETAKWARFLAIIGMVGVALMVLFGLFFSTIMGSMGSSMGEEDFSTASSAFSAMRIVMAVFYIILAVVWFFPMLYLLRFGNTARTALHSNDQEALNVAFQNLKACFRYMGIVTIILLALYALLFAIILMGGGIAAMM